MGEDIAISTARERAGLTISQFAQRLNIPEDKLINIEHNPSGISPRLAKRISEILGMTVDEISFFDTSSLACDWCPFGVSR
ncbi:helix-turn-helix domain-containing protein [Paenibacillus zanthoxyli]|uniref:helix-turn-helix domain-containing protein n=1 Tax=Paenibacillus zanthoxyli TaxID=369399 RepID=UPI000472E53D|nr:helix-turn-helix transcriptional regulator [Paenibacillus zanthoxyli]